MTEGAELAFVELPRAIRWPQRRQLAVTESRAETGRAVVPGHRPAAEQPEATADQVLRGPSRGINRDKRRGVFGDALKHLPELFVVEMVEKKIGDIEMPLAVA
jgi:hypothetical protein